MQLVKGATIDLKMLGFPREKNILSPSESPRKGKALICDLKSQQHPNKRMNLGKDIFASQIKLSLINLRLLIIPSLDFLVNSEVLIRL